VKHVGLSGLQIIPNKAQYKPGEEIILNLTLAEPEKAGLMMHWIICEMDRTLLSGQGKWERQIRIPAIHNGSGAYGVFVAVTDENGARLEAETAFDVAAHWNEAPRYGFLSDFAPGEGEDSTDIDFLNRHHINIVQFYDWMFRHDQLVSQTDEYTDPLNRRNSLSVVRGKIQSLRDCGIASIAYAAVYASLGDYMEQHPEQVLYRNDRQPYSLGNLFYIMDISADSAWTEHIIQEFMKVIELGFDGLHLDQYGFPKKAIRKVKGRTEVVSLKDMYPSFIDRTRDAFAEKSSDIGLIFNNVSNYPIHTTAAANQDAIYIEVWDPMTHLRDIKQLIDRARELSGKQVILAAYLPAFHPERPIEPREAEIGATVTMATIFASGGYHLLLGEHENVLTDAYYPKYGAVSNRFKMILAHYYDFIVMYRNLLYDLQLEDISMTFTGGINTELTFVKEGRLFTPNQQLNSVWTIVKEMPGYLVMHAINLYGLDNDVWHAGKKEAPPTLMEIVITVEVLEEIEGVFWASPDRESIQANSLAYKWVSRNDNSGKYVQFTLPRLVYWSMVCIKTKHGVAIVNCGVDVKENKDV
jgi:dextranase